MNPIISIQTKDQKVIQEFRNSYVPSVGEYLWIENTDSYWFVEGTVTHLVNGGFKIIILVK